jgi:hypothetical protein
MISGEKILITGAAGLGPFPIARHLAKENEVWRRRGSGRSART